MRRSFVALAFVFMFFIVAGYSCSSSQSAADVATQLADKLTDSLNFNSGSEKTGTAPLEHKGDTAYPQVLSVNGNTTLTSGGQFAFAVQFTYSNLSDIAGAIVKVSKYYTSGDSDLPDGMGGEAFSNKYIQVAARGVEGGLALNGSVLGLDPSLANQNFNLLFAVQKKDGTVGNYVRAVVYVQGGGTDAGVITDGGSRADGGAALTCACTGCTGIGAQSVCADNPTVTFTAVSDCTEFGSDSEACTGWRSVVQANYPDNPPAQFKDGTELTAMGCTIQINCPKAAVQ
jgi:hypothetical protein